MRSAVLVSVLAFSVALSACGGGSSPIAPSTPAANVPALSLTPTVDELPVGGGTMTIIVATAATNVAVNLSASNGTLSASSVRTDGAGRAEVSWTGSSSATVTGSAAGGETIASIRVAVPPVPEPEPTPPNPAPAPPNPTPRTPAHDVLGVTVFYNFGAESTTPIVLGAAVFALDGQPIGPLTYAWDFEADGSIDSTEATPSRRFGVGTHPVVLTVRTADGRSGTGTITVFVLR